jgi:hypothetical protein
MEESRTLDSEIEGVKNAHEQIFDKPLSDMQKTTMQVKSLEAKRLVAEDHVRGNLVPYSKAVSRHFCEKIVTRLPLELRSIIYEDLITPDYIYVGPQYLTNMGRPCENDRDAHFWSADYVGEAMFIELAQCWYRVSLFYFSGTKRTTLRSLSDSWLAIVGASTSHLTNTFPGYVST